MKKFVLILLLFFMSCVNLDAPQDEETVTCTTCEGESEETETYSSKVSAPNEIWREEITSNSVKLKWKRQENDKITAKYNLYQVKNFSSTETVVSNISETEYTLSNLEKEIHYSFYIRAVDDKDLESRNASNSLSFIPTDRNWNELGILSDSHYIEKSFMKENSFITIYRESSSTEKKIIISEYSYASSLPLISRQETFLTSDSYSGKYFYIDNQFYYVLIDSLKYNRLSLYKLNGINWESVGSEGFSPRFKYSDESYSPYNYITLIVSDGKPLLAFQDFFYDDKISVMAYTGNTASGWEYLGNPGFSSDKISNPQIISIGDYIYAAYFESNQNKIIVMRCIKTLCQWEKIGEETTTYGFSQMNLKIQENSSQKNGMGHSGMKQYILWSMILF